MAYNLEINKTSIASNNNGGIFNPSSGTVDYTYGANAQAIAYTDLQLVSGTQNQVSSASRPFIAADVGNFIQIAAPYGVSQSNLSNRVCIFSSAGGTTGGSFSFNGGGVWITPVSNGVEGLGQPNNNFLIGNFNTGNIPVMVLPYLPAGVQSWNVYLGPNNNSTATDYFLYANTSSRILTMSAAWPTTGQNPPTVAPSGWWGGFYEITSVSGGVATLSASVASSGTSTSGTGVLGGPISSPNLAINLTIPYQGYVSYISGSFSTACLVFGSGYGDLTGYSTTRGDGGKATITYDGTSPVSALGTTVNNNNSDVQANISNVVFNANGAINANQQFDCIYVGLNQCLFFNCEFNGATDGNGVNIQNSVPIIECSSANNKYGYLIGSCAPNLIRCTAQNNSADGFYAYQAYQTNWSILECFSINNGGIGFNLPSVRGTNIIGCVAYKNASHGFYISNGYSGSILWSCIASTNGGSGFYNCTENLFDNNQLFSYNNTSADTGNYSTYNPSATTTVLASDPFVDAAGGNFTLNDTAGGGALLRGAAWPNGFTGLPYTNDSRDIGAAQSAGTGGGGGLIIPGRGFSRGF